MTGKKSNDGRRVARVESEVQRVVSRYLISHLQSEIQGLVTVSRVKMPADLRNAKVYVSFMGENIDIADALAVLKAHAPNIQASLSDQLEMRYCPKLTFFRDDSVEQVMKVDQLIKHLEDERKRREGVGDEHQSEEHLEDEE